MVQVCTVSADLPPTAAPTSKQHFVWKSALARASLLAREINLVFLVWYESQTIICASSDAATTTLEAQSPAQHWEPSETKPAAAWAAPASCYLPGVSSLKFCLSNPRCHAWPPAPKWCRLPSLTDLGAEPQRQMHCAQQPGHAVTCATAEAALLGSSESYIARGAAPEHTLVFPLCPMERTWKPLVCRTRTKASCN